MCGEQGLPLGAPSVLCPPARPEAGHPQGRGSPGAGGAWGSGPVSRRTETSSARPEGRSGVRGWGREGMLGEPGEGVCLCMCVPPLWDVR